MTTSYGQPAQNQVTSWIYSSTRGWLVEKNHPGETDTETSDPDYTYTPGGRLRTRNHERGASTTYHYDFDGYDAGNGTAAKTGDLAKTDYSDDTPDVTRRHTRWGATKEIDDVSGTRVFTYREGTDLLMETEQTSTANVPTGGISIPKTCTHGYDSLGRMDGYSCGDPSGASTDHAVQHDYDPQTGRLETIIHGNAALGIAEKTFVQSYLPNSNLPLLLHKPDNLCEENIWEPYRDHLKSKENCISHLNTNWFTVEYGIPGSSNEAVNALGQRTKSTYSGLFTTRNGSADIGYNANGEVDSFVRKNTSGNPLIGETFGYGFDPIGNRLNASIDGNQAVAYVPNALNQYGSIITGGVAVNPDHDDDGNLTDDGTRLFAWDAENRLAEVRRKLDNGLIASYRYDHMSRRIWKETTTLAPQGAGETVFHYEGWNLSAEYVATSRAITASTVPARTYTWGLDLSGTAQGAGGVGGLLAIEQKSGTQQGLHYPLYDGNGNVRGTIKANISTSFYDYDAFGRFLRLDGGGFVNLNPFRFSTKYFDRETGFYYYGYRYYDPVTGRWPSRDPIEEHGGLNLYGFADNDGVNWWDLLGLNKGSNEASCSEPKKVFFIGPDQTYIPTKHDPKYMPRGWKPPVSYPDQVYLDLIDAAKNAGYEVIENATFDKVKTAWESKEYFHILYYNHGSATGGLTFNYNRGGKIVESAAPVSVVFNTKSGYSDHLTICCCHSEKVVTGKIELDYMEAKVQISTIPAPQLQNGAVWRPEARNTLLQLFKKAGEGPFIKLCK